ncbi:hypothetical protein D9757_005607 [Collybiopsis confluens]|uniref:Uncharacterized protein n=1 Tax=Collybiopsis confluens TaxID=2823264 RepID=A0A8H5HSS6_9AGAR|nr:hypothetical protein D9757_005607 [Collybiopsis confluens]
MLVAPVCTNKKEPSLPFSHGYWKDLLNILALASTDELDTVNAKFLHHPRSPFNYRDRKVKVNASPEAHRQFIIQIQERAKAERTRIAGERHEILIKRLQDSKYRALYVAVSRLFADQLVKDLQVIDQLDHLPPGQDRIPLLKKLSLAGKWAPTPGASHDRVTNVASAISLLLHHSRSSIPRPFPKALSTFDGSQAESTNPYLILRSYYHRWVLVPLRSLLLVPETLMSANKWSTIRYNRVPSLSMKSNMEHFFKHDPDRFQQYLVDVESGKKTISGATLLPHQIVTEVVKLHNDLQADTIKSKYPKLAEMRKERAVPQLRVLDGQWKSLIDRLKQSGTLDSSLAICDVSGSMGSLSGSNSRHPSPIAPAIALSLVLAQLVKPPFNQAFITFSADPQIVTLNPELSLAETIETMQNSAWGMNTDFNAIFLKLLLPLAVKIKVPKEEMIKQLFVFSDMQFDEASGQEYMDWKTNHDVIAEAYAGAGYDMPKIIYWDLAGNGTMEVTAEREGVAMMNGFSASMLKVFMGEEEEDEGWEKVGKTEKETDEDKFNPLIIMKKSVMKLSFDGLVVLD